MYLIYGFKLGNTKLNQFINQYIKIIFIIKLFPNFFIKKIKGFRLKFNLILIKTSFIISKNLTN